MTKLLSCHGLSVGLWLDNKRYPVINELSFDLHRGKTFALVGESGCGKSMTALALTQLLPPVARYHRGSRIFLDDINIIEQSEVEMQQIRGRRIGMIFQEPMTALNPVLTIGQQIEEVLVKHAGFSRAENRERAIELLAAVGLPSPERRYREYPHQLSGGMKQRVVIAMAIALEPEILVADEPTTALDVTIQAQILELLYQLQEDKGMAILLISHDLGVVSQMADEVAVMYAGRIVEQGPMSQLIGQPKHPYTQQLLAAIPNLSQQDQPLSVIPGTVPSLTEKKPPCSFATRCSFAWERCFSQSPKEYHMGLHHNVRCHLYADAIDLPKTKVPDDSVQAVKTNITNDVVLGVKDLRLHFPVKKGVLQRTVAHVKAVDGIDLAVKRGQTLALVGESGCGKTSLGKAISLLLKPSKGQINLYNQLIYDGKTSDEKRLRQALQMVFQDPFSSLNPRMVVGQLLAEGLLSRGRFKQKQARLDFLKQLLSQVGLPDNILQRYPHEFSGGQRQRISIARTLAVEPEIIICDEPTSALDLSVQAKILNLLKSLQQQKGLAYLFITHDIAVVSYMADEVAVMYLGRIVEQGKTEEILKNPKHPYTQALLKAVPVVGEQGRKVISLGGEQPSALNPPKGCHFAGRCPHATTICREQYPGISQLSNTHQVKCFLFSKS